MTIHSPYGTESLDPGLANDDIIVKGNFTAIMITQDQTGHAEIKLNCLDGTKLLRNRSRFISIIIIPIQKRITREPEKDIVYQICHVQRFLSRQHHEIDAR